MRLRNEILTGFLFRCDYRHSSLYLRDDTGGADTIDYIGGQVRETP